MIHARTGDLGWVDIPAGHLVQSNLNFGVSRRWELGMSLGAIAPRARDEGFAVAAASSFGFAIDTRGVPLAPFAV